LSKVCECPFAKKEDDDEIAFASLSGLFATCQIIKSLAFHMGQEMGKVTLDEDLTLIVLLKLSEYTSVEIFEKREKHC